MKDKENSALIIGAFANLFMAFIAWVTYYYSNSEAILLDGNYSFIMFLSVLVALKIAGIKALKTETFPLGQFFYESLYSFIKGLMMLGVLIMAVITAVIRIISYFYGSMENIPMLIPEPILYYAILVGIICYSLSLNYRYQNNKINNSSIVLKTEQKASFVDGTLSFGIAIGIIFLTRFPDDNGGNFIPYLADSLFVLILSSFLVKEPLTIIKEAIIELAGGTLQNEKTKRSFEKAIEESKVKNIIITDYHLSKNGSKYVILLNVDTKTATINKQDLAEMKKNIELKLKEEYPYLYIEIIPKI